MCRAPQTRLFSCFVAEIPLGIVYNKLIKIIYAESYNDPNIEGEYYGKAIRARNHQMVG